MPFMPLGKAVAKLQPVFVVDVAEAFVESLGRHESFGKSYDLVGPEVRTLRELMAYAGAESGHARPIIGLPDGLGMLQALSMEILPGQLLSRDNLRSLKADSVSSAPLPFGIRPTPLEAIAPAYRAGATPRVRYMALRGRAGR